MKRFARIFLFAVRVTSVVLLVAIVAAWVRSYFRLDIISLVRDEPMTAVWTRKIYAVRSSGGSIMLEYTRSDQPSTPFIVQAMRKDAQRRDGWNWDVASDSNGYLWRFAGPPRDIWHRLGFEAEEFRERKNGDATIYHPSVTLPYWFAALLAGAAPLQWHVASIRHRRRSRVGHCPRCGYDLRATPSQCPECGLVMASTPP